MDDLALCTALRHALTRTTIAAVCRATGLNRNTVRALKDGTHGMNSHTRAALTRWLQPLDLGNLVRQGFAAGASLYQLGAQYGLTQAACEHMIREGLREDREKIDSKAPGSPVVASTGRGKTC